MHNSINNLPKIVTSDYIPDTVQELWRSKVTLADKMNGLYYSKHEFINKKTNEVLAWYEPAFNNKYKLVKVKL
jgi:hypothetical protein